MRVTFIRHGASEWNGGSRLCGQTDVALSTLGHSQAAALAERLEGRRFDALWSSPLQRASVTAGYVGAAIGHAVVTDPRLAEMDLGQFEGARFVDLPVGPGTFRDRWQKNPATVRFPQGENLREVAQRAWTVLQELYDRHPHGHVVVVSHMFTLSALLCRVQRIRVARFRAFAIDVASISTVQMDKEGFRLLLLNDTSHLELVPGSAMFCSKILPERG